MRAARGTLAALGLLPEGWRTGDRVAHLLVEGRCTGQCASCAAACVVRGEGPERGTWPRISIPRLTGALHARSGAFDHAEIAAGAGPGALRELAAAVTAVAMCGLPVWAVFPVRSSADVERLTAAGAVRVVLPAGPQVAGRRTARGSIPVAEVAELARQLHQAYPGRVAVRLMEARGTADEALAGLERAGVPILTTACGEEEALV